MLDSETTTHIGVLQGEEWYKPRDLGKQCDIFYASKGKSYDEPERAKWNDSERRSFNGSWEGTELVDGTVAARVDVLGKVIPRRAIEDKLSKLVKTFISVDGKLVHALLDSGTEITVIKKDLVPGISVEGASTIYLKGIFGPAVKCPLVYVPIGLATGGQVNVVHQQVLCALAEVLVEDVLLPPDVLDMLGGAQSEENSLAQSSQDLRVDSGNVDETEVSSGILPEKAQEHIEDSQRNITSCRNEVGTLGTKDEEVTAEMDKGIMVADSFRSEQECCAELALVWKYAKEGKGNYYEVDGYLFRRDKILGESIGQLGLRADVKKFCESCKECQLTRSVRIKDRSSSTPVARPELPFEVGNMDLIGPIDPPSLKGHKYILRLVDQHTRWGEAVPLTSLSAKKSSLRSTTIALILRHGPIDPSFVKNKGVVQILETTLQDNAFYRDLKIKPFLPHIKDLSKRFFDKLPSVPNELISNQPAYDPAVPSSRKRPRALLEHEFINLPQAKRLRA
ncbi:uncharacterized protein TNCV_2816961 [Trichonephila clavipes]|nr:uncharacterized protein TNCV_2816961 [Trichonephila clavipes]